MATNLFKRLRDWLGLGSDSNSGSFWDLRGSDLDEKPEEKVIKPTLNGSPSICVNLAPAGKVNQKIRQCPFCNYQFSNDDVEFEETASYTPSLMWQVCPTHGRVAEFQWTPAWRYDYPRLPDDTPYRRA